jgi:hypothetical protein
MNRSTAILVAGVALAASLAAGDAPAEPNTGASADGFIYGTVETRNGKTHVGVLRWGDEETFWDDLFHSSKRDLPYLEYAEAARPDEDASWWERVGSTIGREFGVGRESRVVAVRFGDLAGIRPTGADDAVLTLRDGTELEVEGYANDVGTTVTVFDSKPGRIELRWKEIREVRFGPPPPGFEVEVARLRGTVTTATGELTGFIQWDSQECLTTDRLDGDFGGKRVSLAMGDIRSIERRDRRSARVVLDTGEELVLSGTNDVDDDIRGIHVEDPRYGRVEVSWEVFVKLVFDEPGGSGRGYGEFDPPRRLAGTVTTRAGARSSGNLVFDLDEEWTWEMLNGASGELDYTIPFAAVAVVEPQLQGGTDVRLRTGEVLRLDGSHDVSADNSGVVVLSDRGAEPEFVPWREIRRIEFR